MFNISRVSDEILAQWRELARQASHALNFAGVPAYLIEDEQDRPGAEIKIDAADDEAGGVFVSWQPSRQLWREVVEDTRNGLHSTPSHNLFGTIAKHMQDAITGILRDSGFDAVPFNDGVRSPAVHVLGRTAKLPEK